MHGSSGVRNRAMPFCLVTHVVLLDVTFVSSNYTKEDTHSESMCEEDPDDLLLPNHRGYHQDNWISWWAGQLWAPSGSEKGYFWVSRGG